MLPAPPALPANWRRQMLIVVVVALAARAIVLAIFSARGLRFPFVDAGGYVAQADWLLHHGNLAIPERSGARYFHGVPFFLAGLGRLSPFLAAHLAVVGLTLNFILAGGACALFYRLFPRLDWACWHALLLPSWLAMSSTLHGEGALWAFSLLGLLALRLPRTATIRLLLLPVAGYAMVCRPTAIFILLPAFLVAWWRPAPRDLPRLLAEAALLGIFPVLTAAWSLASTGQVFIQSAHQASEFAWWSAHWGGTFPAEVFTWPGRSFAAVLASDHIRPAIKLLNLAHLAFFAGALLFSIRAWRRAPSDSLAAWLVLGLVINGAFILTIGGPFGGSIFYRFLATQANVFVLLAWFRHASLPPAFWWTASAASLGLASLIARNTS